MTKCQTLTRQWTLATPATALTVPGLGQYRLGGTDMTDRTCGAPSCDRPLLCKGYCSLHYQRMRAFGSLDLPERQTRFWPRVNKTPSCWIWAGAKTAAGYGHFWDGKRTVYAHRFSYELAVGPIPGGLQIDHLCRNRACVNPAHLEPVTAKVNVRRGTSMAVTQSRAMRRTHCKRGHEFSSENTSYEPNGARICKKCVALRARLRRAERRRADA